jgi:hypothetical protein
MKPTVYTLKAGLLILVVLFQSKLLIAQSAAELAKTINVVSYGVPSSPAFEFLPGKTSEVVNLITPQDFATQITNIFDGKKLKTGAAFDARPFIGLAGDSLSLIKYQTKFLARIAWRTLFSIGTAPDETVKGDVFVSGGLRIPIYDGGDPRSDKAFLNSLNEAAENILKNMPGDEDTTMSAIEINLETIKATKKALDSIRTNFFKTSWNKPKLDVGFAYMIRSKSGALQTDSLSSDKYGIWLAGGWNLGKWGQVIVSGKITRGFSTPKSETEVGRNTLGARARGFALADRLAVSIELANIWANYQQTSQNESWRHTAILVEYHLPILKGWLGVAYGGDTPHRTNLGSKFSLSYAVYTNQLIKK